MAGLQNVNLMGPNPAQPFDIQAAQAQLELRQQIAQALMAQGLSPTQMLDTGAVKVANWGDALGKMAKSYMAGQALGDIGQQQQDLANQVLERRKAELQQAFSPRMDSGAPSSMGTRKPTMMEIAQSLMQSNDPNNMAAGNAMMAQMGKAAEAAQVKSSDLISAGRWYDPRSVPGAMGVNDWGFPIVAHPEKLELKPEVVKTTPEERASVVSLQGKTPTEAVPPTPMPPRVVPSGENYPGTNVPNPNPQDMQVSTRGEVTPVGGAQAVAAADTAKLKVQQADESQQDLISRRNMLQQQVSMLKIAQYAADHGGNFGASGKVMQEVRKWASSVGISPDEANKITDFEYFIKNAVPQAARNAREGVGARVPVVEYQGFTNALGAGGTTDPRAMAKIVQDQLLNTLNLYETHKNIVLPSLEAAAGRTKSYKAPPLDVQKDIVEPLREYGLPLNWQQDSSGYWMNPYTPGQGAPAYPVTGKPAAPAPRGLPPGFEITPVQ